MITWIKQEKAVFAWMPPMVWAFVILVFSVLPYVANLQLTVGHFDKMAHFFEYAILAALVVRSVHRVGDVTFSKKALFALIICGGYGILMELAQIFVPGRDLSMADITANFVGIFSGIAIGRIILWQK